MKKKVLVIAAAITVGAFAITGVILPNDPQPPRPMAVFQVSN